MVVRDSVIFGIPLDPTDPSNNAMTPVSGISQGRDIDFDDQQQLVYWVQSSVSWHLKFKFAMIYIEQLFKELIRFNVYNHRDEEKKKVTLCRNPNLNL